MLRLLVVIGLGALLAQAGCACAPLGDRTLPSGEDKYSAKYD